MFYPFKADLIIVQGATFDPVVTGAGGDGSLFDWTGWKGRMQIRAALNSGTVLKELTTENSGIVIAGTQVKLFISAADTAELNFANGVYDLEMYRDTVSPVEVRRILKGKITVDLEITR